MRIISVNITDDEEELLELFKKVTAKETTSLSKAIKIAMKEYIERHAKSVKHSIVEAS